MPTQLVYNNPFGQSVNPGWYNKRMVYYMNLGPLVIDETKNEVADIYQFVYGFNENNQPIRVQGQLNVIDVVPIDENYTPLWKIVYVVVPPSYIIQSIRSIEDIKRSGFKTVETDIIINCPVL